MDGEYSPGTFRRSSPSHNQEVLVLQGQAHPYTPVEDSWNATFIDQIDQSTLVDHITRQLMPANELFEQLIRDALQLDEKRNHRFIAPRAVQKSRFKRSSRTQSVRPFL